MSIRLILRGDDAASTRSATTAIAQCFTEGVVRNASLMAPGPELTHAAEVLRPLQARGLCIGLHATINSEWAWPKFRPVLPAEQVPSLVGDDGAFLPAPRHLAARGFDVDEVIAELEVQYDALKRVGLDPVYLDEHMGIGQLEGLGPRIKALAGRLGLIYAAEAAPYLPEVEDGPTDPGERWRHRIAQAAPGTYVFFTHPAVDDEDMRRCGPEGENPGRIAMERDAERRALLDPALQAFFEENDVNPIRYDEV